MSLFNYINSNLNNNISLFVRLYSSFNKYTTRYLVPPSITLTKNSLEEVVVVDSSSSNNNNNNNSEKKKTAEELEQEYMDLMSERLANEYYSG
jgi:hypothetical protein